MSIHINAPDGSIAPYVLMPGDPLRAKWIAETFLEGAEQYNDVRGMLGYTGTYKGVRISTQGSGMGQPSMAIYAHELFHDYDVQAIVRVGTAGGMSTAVKVRDVVIGQTASTDSSMNIARFGSVTYAPGADFELLRHTYDVAVERGLPAVVGGLYSSDQFYNPKPITETLAAYGVLGVEMEAAALYTLAAQFGRRALSVCTISDHLITGEETSAKERQETFDDMMIMALEAVVRLDAAQ
ncbi:MAG: purine-nucleoside phosphorylase [Dermabacter sp.]|nr:purine-nucleoside phosphorylase [Dermabacter sp.]